MFKLFLPLFPLWDLLIKVDPTGKAVKMLYLLKDKHTQF